MADALKDALDKWSWSGGADNWNQVIAGTYGNILGFRRGQEVVDQMRDYNAKLGNVLTEGELISGLNKFSKSQYDHYGSGYAVDSDPFNIGRWSVAQALIDKGSPDAGYKLIHDTDARQAITSQQAIEIGKKAQADYAAADAQLRDMAKVVGYGGGTTLGDYHMESDGFGDFLMAVAPAVMLSVVGASALGWGGFAAAGAEAAGTSALAAGAGSAPLGALGSGLAGVDVAGLGLYGQTAATAGTLGTGLAGTTAASLVPAAATTGGLLVGSEGVFGSTGNAIGDQAVNSALQNAGKAVITGNDPVQGALQGAAGGLIGASGIGAGAAELVGATGDAGAAVTTGVNAAAGAGAMTAINGGSFSDVLENSLVAGASQGAGSYVSNALDSGSNAIDRGVGGAVAGGTNAALTGGDVGTGLLTSGIAGAAGGLAADLGAGPEVSGVVQGVVGGIVNSELQPDDVVNPPPATAPTATTTRPDVSSVSFSDVIPQFVDKSVEWGTRLQQSGGI